MPRPFRKPKKFNPQQMQNTTVDVPVISTPVHAKYSTTGIASPGLSPIQRKDDFTIFNDDHAEQSTDKALQSNTNIETIDETVEEEIHAEEEEEDIYGAHPPTKSAVEHEHEPSPTPQVKPSKPVKAARHLRTSELLSQMPTRRKRTVRQPKMSITLDSDCSDAETHTKTHAKSKKKRVVKDKENAEPAEESESEDDEVVERRKVIKSKFAEVDNWEMAFEEVDLSFSSQ